MLFDLLVKDFPHFQMFWAKVRFVAIIDARDTETGIKRGRSAAGNDYVQLTFRILEGEFVEGTTVHAELSQDGEGLVFQ